MLTLRLFRQSDPFRQIEARSLAAGALTLGRSEECDWVLPDPERRLSRRHCDVAIEADGPVLRDLSTNGVFIGRDRERPPARASVPLAATETVRLGDYLLVVETACAEAEAAAPRPAADAEFLRPIGEADADAAPGIPDTPLLEAFCEGARIDVSALGDEPPEAVMRRAGAVYREVISGLAALMTDRTALKAEHRLERTSVGADGNNPFRWAGPERLRLDLLRPRDDGFLTGPEAIAASLGDLKKHLDCTGVAYAAACRAAIETLSPDALEARAGPRTPFGVNRAAALWRAYLLAHAEQAAAAQVGDSFADGAAFAEAYRRRLNELHAAEDART